MIRTEDFALVLFIFKVFTKIFNFVIMIKHIKGEYYDKKISEGKHHFVALAGISRKLLTIIYYILKEDRDYIRYDNIKDKLN